MTQLKTPQFSPSRYSPNHLMNPEETGNSLISFVVGPIVLLLPGIRRSTRGGHGAQELGGRKVETYRRVLRVLQSNMLASQKLVLLGGRAPAHDCNRLWNIRQPHGQKLKEFCVHGFFGLWGKVVRITLRWKPETTWSASVAVCQSSVPSLSPEHEHAPLTPTATRITDDHAANEKNEQIRYYEFYATYEHCMMYTCYP